MRAVLLAAAFLVGITLLEYRVVQLIQGANLPAQVEAVHGILSGHPEWKAYQNRLLGPETVYWVSRLTGLTFTATYQAFCFAMLFVANATCYFLFHSHTKRPELAWAYTVAYLGLFIAFQDASFLYLWDYIDLTVMLLFAWAVVMGRGSPGQLAALFAVELLNRESAQFIALWIVISSIHYRTGAKFKIDPVRLLAGVILGVTGSLWTSFLRNHWCIAETGVVPRKEIYEFAGGQFFMLRVTFDLLREFPSVATVTILILFLALAYPLYQSWSALAERAWQVGLIVGVLAAANLCLAFILELRVWFGMLPFLPCLACFQQEHSRRV